MARSDPPSPSPRRLRKGLRRHGLVPRPRPLPAILRSQSLRFTEGNHIEVFDWGRDALQAMLEAVRGAQRQVHLETYIFRSDGIGTQFLEALTERARAGVDVRLLYDAMGSLAMDPAALVSLTDAGASVVAFNPLSRLWSRWLPRRRDHRKILVVDSEVAFTGGINVGDEYGGNADDPGWRDTHVRLYGPCVRDLEAVFLESWFRADGPELDWHVLLGAAPEEHGPERCAVLPDGPVYRRRRMRELVIEGLAAAKQRVRFASPYFAPGRQVQDALVAAGRRGVQVELLVAGTPSDHPWLRRGSHGLYPRLLQAGVRVYEYQGTMMHAKVAVFDDDWAVVGTSNLDRQSFRHSYEVNLVVSGSHTAEALVAGFERDFERARRVDVGVLARRSPSERLLDWIAGLALRLV